MEITHTIKNILGYIVISFNENVDLEPYLQSRISNKFD